MTIASNEHGFSKLKIIKSRLRSTMADNRLQTLLFGSVEADVTDALVDEEVIAKWMRNKSERVI